MIVLIPLGGIGERFKKFEYTKPKALIEVGGKCIIFHLLDNIKILYHFFYTLHYLYVNHYEKN